MIGRLNHVAIAVKDLEKAASVYRNALGAKVGAPTAQPEHGVTVVFIELPNTKIELLEPLGENSPIAKFLEKRGPGLHHIALRVPDLNAAVASLKAAGARLLNEPRQGAGGHTYVFVHPASAGGVLLELIQGESH